MAEDNMMKQFAPLLIGAGLVASVYWFADTARRPRGFSGGGLRGVGKVLGGGSHTSAAERAARRLGAKQSAQRIADAQAETRAIVATGACPRCGGALVRNLGLSGWWQCAQFGSPAFRRDPSKPPCPWQGFTE